MTFKEKLEKYKELKEKKQDLEYRLDDLVELLQVEDEQVEGILVTRRVHDEVTGEFLFSEDFTLPTDLVTHLKRGADKEYNKAVRELIEVDDRITEMEESRGQ